MATLSGPNATRLFQYRAVISAIRLESKGLRHSSGRSARKAWALHLGLKPSAKAAVVIAALEAKCAEVAADLTVTP